MLITITPVLKMSDFENSRLGSILVFLNLILLLSSCDNHASKSYFESGKLKTVSFYHKDMLTHKRVFYENGHLELECHYRNNKLDGMYTAYDSTGRLVLTSQFKEGVQEGLYTYYHPNGKVQTYALYKNGKPNGVSIDYTADGDVNKRSVLEEGRLKFSYSYDISGKIIGEYHGYQILPSSDTINLGVKNCTIQVEIFGSIIAHEKIGVLYQIVGMHGAKNESVLVFSSLVKKQTIDCSSLTRGIYHLSVHCATLDKESPVETLTRVLVVS